MNSVKFIAILVLSALLSQFVFASTVTRFVSSTVKPGADLTITLLVDVTGTDSHYGIDETVPAGWTVRNAGSGSTAQAGHLKWGVIQYAVDTNYVYVLTAPASTGTGTFTGKYMFETMTAEAEILGTTSVTITSSACSEGQITASCQCNGTSYSTGYCCSGFHKTTACTPQNCLQGQITTACYCAGTLYSSGYCCSNQYSTSACSVPACSQGAITSACTCGSTQYSSGYCCNNQYSTTACTASNCAEGQITSACSCGGTQYSNGYCCSSQWQAVACGTTQCQTSSDCATGKACCNSACITPACSSSADCASGQTCSNPGTCTASCSGGTTECTSDAECSAGKLCCSSVCRTIACGAAKQCSSNYQCTSPDTCSAKCSFVPLKKLTAEAPEIIVIGQPFTVTVKDEAGNPLEGATVKYGTVEQVTGADGTATHIGAKFQVVVTVKKEGYQSLNLKRVVKSTGSTGEQTTPTTVSGGRIKVTIPAEVYYGEEFIVAVESDSGDPVPNATVTYSKQSVQTDVDGIAVVMAERNAVLVQVKSPLGTATARVLPKKPVASDVNATEEQTDALTQEEADLLNIILAAFVIIGIALFIKFKKR